MSVLTLIYLMFMLWEARSFRDTFAESLRLRFENADLVETLTRDIAARETAERALRASEERLRLTQHALDHAHDLVAIVDRAGGLLYLNESYCRYTGRSQAEIAETPAWEWLGSLNEPHFRSLWDEAKQLGTRTFETEVCTHGGERKPVEVSVSFLEFGGREAICTISRDLTARRATERERERIERQLQEIQKLESLGVLAGGVAHDFNNLFTVILGNAGLARKFLPGSPESQDALSQIELTSHRAANLVKQMLAYAGKGSFASEPIDLSRLIADFDERLKISVSNRAQLELRLESDLPPISGDATQLRQVIMNLIINSTESIDHREGVIVLGTSRAPIDRAFLESDRAGAHLPQGDGVFLEVRDNGCGMDRATLDRMFDPFFTTKFTGRGLGLAAVLGIVRAHNGGLSVDSAPGRGTTVRLAFMPAAWCATPCASVEIAE